MSYFERSTAPNLAIFVHACLACLVGLTLIRPVALFGFKALVKIIRIKVINTVGGLREKGYHLMRTQSH
ncbi:hypothetical protein NPIL_55591 [Nephila pilipes]|uniref:Uncharacterized protein n=1 Tax=Nephila pilipes TaxID=299642 RepID=A0A8X6QRQ7_NEPPI|nr:hypothetical protein NPIL_55591 [Nephila pilipes]